MRLAVACDHRGFEAKRRLLPLLKKLGHEVVDFGCDGTGAVDYPDYAAPAARAVAANQADAGILMDGSGIGMSIAANKITGVRAALVHDEVTARRAREHNHCNVLCLGTDLLGEEHIRSIVEIFLSTPFGEGRHTRRVEKLCLIEREERGHAAPAATVDAAAAAAAAAAAPAPSANPA
jgi:ribose 5-phosphate isomerase B